MKNLQKLLLVAVVASTPSTIIVCSETPKEPTATLADYLIKTPMTSAKLGVMPHYDVAIILSAVTAQAGVYTLFGALGGSHSLKQRIRNLSKANNLTPETRIELDKGIKNNRIGMLASLIAIASCPITLKLIAVDQAQKQDNLFKHNTIDNALNKEKETYNNLIKQAELTKDFNKENAA